MRQVILGRIGEIALKGLNRGNFEKNLARNIKEAIKPIGNAKVVWSQSRFFIEPEDYENYDYEEAIKRLSCIFGLVSISPAWEMESDFETIKDNSLRLVKRKIDEFAAQGKTKVTFKVETRRGLKTFPMKSPEISANLGGEMLEAFAGLSVDVNNPDFILYTEVREKSYIYTDTIPAQGGMPIGSNGKACLLLSGGIDSPVAGYMIAKRGVKICAVHFYSYPYTSERAKEKVVELARLLTKYCGSIKLMVVPYTDVQLAIHENCRDELGTVIMRRSMMRIAEILARKNGCSALVTGESVGQVASQTMAAMYCTDNAANIPVFRPLIGMDKVEVIERARNIDTFETSIQPYEDCCTVFTPKHPKTKPCLDEVLAEEEKYDFKALELEAVNNTEIIRVGDGEEF